ncbi:hypothetical protein JCM33374_g4069 [Metschnikowia sp. JCM 33374]|nr:hypothetical protein JCM33374_g4069 [Metschnikowia sp. JCM 33374]
MNLIRKFIKTSPTDEIASIPMGKFFLARSLLSPKGALECLFNDCVLSMKRTTKPFCYQLSVTRAYQEGESSSQSTGEFEDGDDDDAALETVRNSDERSFFLTEDLQVRLVTKDDGSQIIAWRDVNGDVGERLEFAIDEEIKYNDVDAFMRALYECLYEQKYGKSSSGISEADLKAEFGSPEKKDRGNGGTPGSMDVLHQLKSFGGNVREEEHSDDEHYGDASSIPFFIFKDSITTEGSIVDSFKVQLRIFDATTDSFILVHPNADIRLMKATLYSLVSQTPKFAFSVPVAQEINPVFNIENLAFIFNFYSLNEQGNGASFSMLFQFHSIDDFSRFSHIFQDAMTKSLNPKIKSTDPDLEYLTRAVENMDLGGADDEATSDSEYEDEDGDDVPYDEHVNKIIKDSVKSKYQRQSALFVPSDSEEDEDDEKVAAREKRKFLQLKDPNSGLSVGNANDRSYVTRGDNVGVFKQGEDSLEFMTMVNSIKDTNGKKFIPKSNMLHQRDNYLLMTKDGTEDNKIYKMDLARGQIVESWSVDDNGSFSSFAPISKFAPLTDEQKLIGASSNSLFHIDPRLSGSKVVSDTSYKAYKTKTAFENLAVTDKGWVAVGSKDGTIRLYDRLGKKSTVTLPSIGEGYVGMDVSKDGRWLICTCETSLLLIDTKIGPGQKNKGEIGFKKYFDADKKPVPKRLTLEPKDVTLITQWTGKPKIKFTRAVFNTSLTEEETHIITSTGPFVISWSLKDITKKPTKPKYKLERCQEDVVSKSFSLHSQNNIFAALQNDVVSTQRKALRVANKKLILDRV